MNVQQTRQEAISTVLENIGEFGSPDVPGMEHRISIETEMGSIPLSGINLIRACAYTRQHPVSDARFLPVEELVQKELRPTRGTPPLCIEEASVNQEGNFEILLRQMYPASSIKGFEQPRILPPLSQRMETVASFLTSKGCIPKDRENGVSIVEALEEYGLKQDTSLPEKTPGIKERLFAWLAMRNSGLPYDAKKHPILNHYELETEKTTLFPLLTDAFLSASQMAGEYAKDLILFNGRTNQNKDEPFQELSIMLHWNEGKPLELPEQGIQLSHEENQLFTGKEAYELLVGLVRRDRQCFKKRIVIPGYDKCKLSIYLSRNGKEKLSFENNRIDLGDLELGRGKTPMDALVGLLGGNEYQRYTRRPYDFKESYLYQTICEDAEKQKNKIPSSMEALNSCMKEWKDMVDAFQPLIQQEQDYLIEHPKLQKVVQDVPKPYYFLCRKDQLPSRFSYLDIEEATGIDGIVYQSSPDLTCDIAYSLPHSAKKYEKEDAKGYYLITSAFDLAREDERNRKKSPFHPYLPKEREEAIRNFSMFSLCITSSYVPGTSDYDYYLRQEKKEREANGESEDKTILPTNQKTTQGISAMKELFHLSETFKKTARESRTYGFVIPNEKKQISLSYNGKEYLSIQTIPGKDDLFRDTFCKEENTTYGFPLPEGKEERDELWNAITETMLLFRDPDDVLLPCYNEYQFDKPIPSTKKEQVKNVIGYLKNSVKNGFRGYEGEMVACGIEVLARQILEENGSSVPGINSAIKEGKEYDELLGIVFTFVASKIGFDKDNVKRLIESSRLTTKGKKRAAYRINSKTFHQKGASER